MITKPGVVEVKASYMKQRMTVKYDEERLNELMIIEAVHRLGYTAECGVESH